MSHKRVATAFVSSTLFLCILAIGGCTADFAGAPEEYYACTPPDIAQDDDHPRAAEYQAFLDDVVSGGMPGAAIFLRSDDGLVWSGASGKADMTSGVDMRSCHLSRGGSITKTFTAVLVMQLVEEGVLELDDPISQYLPATVLDDIGNADVATIRQVLSHTSGIPDYTSSSYLLGQFNDPFQLFSLEDNLNSVRGSKPDFAPGTDWKYSNTNYELAGLLVAEVSGMPYEEFLTEHILEPLKLEQTFINTDGTTPSGMVRGYLDMRGDGMVYDVTDHTLGITSPGGAVVSTVYELAHFLEALLGGELLSQQALDEMQKWTVKQIDDEEVLYGLGLQSDETDYGYIVGHAGGMVGYTATVFHLPDTGATAAVLINGSFGRAHQALHDELLPELPDLLHTAED